jgi:hypothetical protein
MKLVTCYEGSLDNKTWVRFAVESKTTFAHSILWQKEYFTYTRITKIKVPNKLKIEKLI